MSSDLPTTESELLLRMPDSNQSGALPRKWLLRGERILFETRPSLWSLYWGRIVLVLAFFLLVLIDATDPTYQTSAAYWGFEGFILVVPLGIVYAAWRGRAYALTSQRVLAMSGLVSPSLEYASYEEVQNLTSSGGTSGEVRFDIGAPGNAGAYPRAAGRPRQIRWRGLRNAPAVYNYLQDAFRIRVIAGAKEATMDAFVREALVGRIVCEYCGGLIDLERVDRSAPKCLQCGAPLTLARPAV